jgi:hypothetical protein
MSYFYVLTYWGNGMTEFWFREKAVDIVDCIDDFMYPDDEYSELEFTITLDQLDVVGDVDLTEALELEKHMYKHKPAIGAIKKLARILDKNLKIKISAPDDVRYCKYCNIFTLKTTCSCGNETMDCET